MIASIEMLFRSLRKRISRSEWLIKLLRLSKSENTENEPGLVLIQIDGLSFRHFQSNLKSGNLPFLHRLRGREKYTAHLHYSGMPSSTPAVQGELFYGIKGCVPAFRFRNSETGNICTMYDPQGAQEIEHKLALIGNPLLREGSAYCDIFTGGAKEPHFCASTLGWGGFIKGLNPLTSSIALLLNVQIVFRTLVLLIIELVLSVYDFLRGSILHGKNFIEELRFIFTRVAICILLRELLVVGAKIDIARGLPIVHVNFVGYDEQSHRRGPSSRFALWSLRGIDDSIRRLWEEARRSHRREYDLWIYSDHGQLDVTPYAAEYGRSAEDAISAVIKKHLNQLAPSETVSFQKPSLGVQSKRVNLLGCHFFQRIFASEPGGNEDQNMVITAMGPIGHVYLTAELTDDERKSVAKDLTVEAKIPLVMTVMKSGEVRAWNEDGEFSLPEDIDKIVDPDHPFLSEVGEDLLALCRNPSAGTFIISTWRRRGKPLTFPMEEGAHGGPGAGETTGFALLPSDAVVEPVSHLRPGKIYLAAQRFLGRMSNIDQRQRRYAESKTLRVMTYNVHSCIGMDGKISPYRIARVIARHDPDIVALQEVDVRRSRTGGQDQAEAIAKILNMTFHFMPALEIKEERYGDAVLSRYPLRLVKAAKLPNLGIEKWTEPRGAIWVEIDAEGRKIQLLNTHLSLWHRERLRQAEALMGEAWAGHPDCSSGPLILCGDFNALPKSAACRRISRRLYDAQLNLDRHRPHNTFFGRYPFGRIDHVFVNEQVKILDIKVPCTELEKVSSDHLPLIVDFKFTAPHE